MCMLILRKCADYVIIIHTGHGDFGDKDIVHQAKVLCVVCVQKNLMLTPEVSSKAMFSSWCESMVVFKE